MKKRKWTTLLILMISVSVFGFASHAVGDVKPMTIKISTAKPENDARSVAAIKLKELLEKKSAGKIKVTLYLTGTLYGEKNEAQALSGGAVEMVSLAPYTLRRFNPIFTLGICPDVFATWEQWYKFYADPAGGGAIDAAAHKAGLHCFPDWYNSAYYFTAGANIPIKKVSDWKGLKLRTPVGLEPAATAVGASPMAIPSAEAVTAIQTGVVDGYIYSNIDLTKSQWMGVTKYYVDYPLKWLGSGAVCAGKRWWDKRTAEEKALIAGAVKEAADYTNKFMEKEQAQIRAWMKSKNGYGDLFYDMPKEDPAENAKWAKMTADAFLKFYIPQWPDSFEKAITKATGKKM